MFRNASGMGPTAGLGSRCTIPPSLVLDDCNCVETAETGTRRRPKACYSISAHNTPQRLLDNLLCAGRGGAVSARHDSGQYEGLGAPERLDQKGIGHDDREYRA
jgi:hypothetical protein